MVHDNCDKPFYPPRSFVFLKRFIGKRAHYCQHNWFNTFEFLHYDVSKDTVLSHLHSGRAAEEDKEDKKAILVLKYILYLESLLWTLDYT